MSLILGTTPIAGLTPSTKYNAHGLFDFKWTDHLLNDQSWLQANGSWCDGTTYSDAYNHLVADISGITAETETIAGYTVTFYRATDGHKICLAAQETTVSDIYTATGIAWYYILDTTNTRFKLPRSEWGFVGYRDNVGNYIAPGLPDVQGSVGALVGTNTSSGVGLKSGAFSDTTFTGTENWRGTGSAISKNNVHFKASKYNTIYGGSSTVQPPATQMYLYFYVGEFSQTATEQSAGLNAELFNGKADTDLSNTTASLDNSFLNKITPDYANAIHIDSGYICPSAGYVYMESVAYNSNGVFYLYINNVLVYETNQINHSNRTASGMFVVAKNDVITNYWSNMIAFETKFAPMKGV